MRLNINTGTEVSSATDVHYTRSGAQPLSPEIGVRVAGINPTIARQRQARHVVGTPEWTRSGEESYLDLASDGQKVIDAVRRGEAEVLGVTKQGHLLVRYDEVTGTNVNRGAGYPSQPTNIFMIKGTKSPSVVPTSPTKRPERS